MLVRGEQHRHLTRAGEEGRIVRGEQRAGGMAEPFGAGAHEQVVAVHAHPRVVGNIQFDELAVRGEFETLRPVEVDRAVDEAALVSGSVVVPGGDSDIGALTFEDRLGLIDRSAAPPTLRESRITRVGERPVAEIASHIDGVGVDPPDVRLRLG